MKTSNNNNTRKNNTSATRNACVISNNAKAQVREAVHGLMWHINALNRLARKNEFCEGASVRAFGVLVQKLHGEKDYFHASVFTKDSNGKACVIKHSKKMPVWGVDVLDVNENGYTYLAPVRMTTESVFNAFKAVVLGEARKADANAKAEKRAERERAKAERAKAQAVKALKSARDRGYLSDAAYRAELVRIGA